MFQRPGNLLDGFLILFIVSVATAILLSQTHSPSISSPNTFNSPPTTSTGDLSPILVVNATVWTGHRTSTASSFPRAAAFAYSPATGRILDVAASSSDLQQQYPGARVMDAGQRLIVPGFTDSHVHFIRGGLSVHSVQLRDAGSREEFVRRVAEYVTTIPSKRWILEGGWDHERMGALPHREWIDAVTPENPVWVCRLDGHMCLANSLALRLAGVDRNTADITGGQIDRDDNGEPTGILRDKAMDLVLAVIPDMTEEEQIHVLEAAMAYTAEQGVTSVHHVVMPSGGMKEFNILLNAWKRNQLRTRIYAAVPLPEWQALDRILTEFPELRDDPWLRVGMVKEFTDGSLGSKTGYMKQPFENSGDNRGILINDMDEIYRNLLAADRHGYQAVTHAIGDAANAALLDVYERVAQENGPRDRRFRIEHAQHLDDADVGRLAQNGFIASVQAQHLLDDGNWAESVVGKKRTRNMFMLRSLLDLNTTVAMGSDWFVSPPIPLEGIFAAATRRVDHGVFIPEERISVEEALYGYTGAAAYAAFEENRVGKISPGYFADWVMLDQDITEIDPEKIKDTQVLLTVVGGKIVYKNKNFKEMD
eukprot:gb/GECH01014925.1/.p1 GENE.gb/GECH01014925.1/~~gb/GECH01014925.1/.p1  ORF type:complete len:593 (+),score=143.09 gb/GECH01014925.1/:1-1779(+)